MLTVLLLAGCGEPAPEGPAAPEPASDTAAAAVPTGNPPRGDNLLLVILDDVGVEPIAAYDAGPYPAKTPTIDALAAGGEVFLHAYGDPTCSPTRAQLQTGRHGWRTGIGHALDADIAWTLQPEEVTLAELVQRGPTPYATSYVGKWHLGTYASPDFRRDPNVQGYAWFGGLLMGFEREGTTDDLPQGYYDWEKTTNGVAERTTAYVTGVQGDDAVARVAAMPEPWLLVVGLSAAHAPYQTPPDGTWSEDDPRGATKDQIRFNAALEAADAQLGRILAATAGLARGTDVFVIGDNGTPPEISGAAGKGSTYEGGVRVPLVVSGPIVGVPGSRAAGLVSAVDLFATFADIAGADLAAPDLLPSDSVSLLPLLRDPDAPGREFAYSEAFTDPGPPPWIYHNIGVRDARWRLVRMGDAWELYDLGEDQVEGEDLLADGVLTAEEQAAYDRLLADVPVVPGE